MKIVIQNSDNTVIMIAEASTDRFTSPDYTIYNAPNWDWSLADLTGVDQTANDWIKTQLKWDVDRNTLVKK